MNADTSADDDGAWGKLQMDEICVLTRAAAQLNGIECDPRYHYFVCDAGRTIAVESEADLFVLLPTLRPSSLVGACLHAELNATRELVVRLREAVHLTDRLH